MTDKTKKTRLSKFSFEDDGAAVALVGSFQGGPANNHTTLITKSTSDITEEALEKALDEPEKNSLSSAESQDEDVVKAEDKDETISKTKEESTDMADQKIEKSELEVELQKAQDQLAELQKAADKAEEYKKEKEDLEKSFSEVNKTVEVLKAAEEKRKEQEFLQKAAEHTHVVNDDLPAADLAKALRTAEETEGCEALVKAFESYRDLFKNESALEEIGKSKTEDQPNGSKLDAAIEKAQKEHDVDYMKAIDLVKAAQPDLFNEEYA